MACNFASAFEFHDRYPDPDPHPRSWPARPAGPGVDPDRRQRVPPRHDPPVRGSRRLRPGLEAVLLFMVAVLLFLKKLVLFMEGLMTLLEASVLFMGAVPCCGRT
eukprot:2578262-Rhodomonas_salina.2